MTRFATPSSLLLLAALVDSRGAAPAPVPSRLRASRVLRGGSAAAGRETHAFKAEINQLMSLIINSFYSDKEIFLRELISNSADAIDKVRHQGLTDEAALATEPDLHVALIPDADAGTLTIRDTGVGMRKEELQENLGTIAHSGTKAFMQALDKGEADLSLIGQFGVGFYSAFLVADSVTVYSKHNDEAEVHRWHSEAAGTYTIEPSSYEGLRRGTAVVLKLKPEHTALLAPHKLREVVKKHSEFVQHPIRLWQPAPPPPPGEAPPPPAPPPPPPAAEGDATVEDVPVGAEGGATSKEEAAASMEWATLNEQPPIWMTPPAELTAEMYASFYRAISGDWEAPHAHQHFHVEGQVEMRGLLFLPRRAPLDLFERERPGARLRLYVRRVLVLDECDALCPDWLSFLRGVVDSDDLPLNVSREMLQAGSALLRRIRKHVVKKAVEMMLELAEDEARYAPWYEQFGKQLKLGVHEEEAHRAKLAALLRFDSTRTADGKQVSLAQYVARMPAEQEAIYYLAGESLELLRASPLLEALRARGYEVLLMPEPIDEYAMQQLTEFEGKPFVCVAMSSLDLGPAEAADADPAADIEGLCRTVQQVLGRRVEQVRPSDRLSSSPCCLVTGEHGWSANMERIMRAQALRDPSAASFMASSRILEINPRHPLVHALASLAPAAAAPPQAGAGAGEGEDGGREAGGGDAVEAALAEQVELLYESALLTSGFSLDQPGAFATRIHNLMGAALGVRAPSPTTADAPTPDDGAANAAAPERRSLPEPEPEPSEAAATA